MIAAESRSLTITIESRNPGLISVSTANSIAVSLVCPHPGRLSPLNDLRGSLLHLPPCCANDSGAPCCSPGGRRRARALQRHRANHDPRLDLVTGIEPVRFLHNVSPRPLKKALSSVSTRNFLSPFFSWNPGPNMPPFAVHITGPLRRQSSNQSVCEAATY